MKVIHLVIVLCFCCVHSSFGVPRLRQPSAKWRPNAATTATPTMTKFSNPDRSVQEEPPTNLNEKKLALPTLENSTKAVNTLEKVGDGKEYDHKHRVLLAVQSDVKVRDRVKQQEVPSDLLQRNDMPDSRKRLKDGLKELITKLHSAHSNSVLKVDESKPTNEMSPNPATSGGSPLSDIPQKRQRPGSLKMLECEDIPHSEALLNSALFYDVNDGKGKTQKLMVPGPATSESTDNIEDLTELRKKLLKSRRSPLKMMSPYHGFTPYIWPTKATPYNHFNMRNPYSYCDCNYILNPLNEVGVPTVEYIWGDYEDAEGGNAIDGLLKTKKKNSKE